MEPKIDFKLPQEILDKFNAYELSIRDITKRALDESSDIIEYEMMKNAPKRTGNLARNIRKGKFHYTNGVPSQSVGVSKKVFYAKFVEMGTSKRSAKPFVVPSLQNTQDQVEQHMREVIKRELGL